MNRAITPSEILSEIDQVHPIPAAAPRNSESPSVQDGSEFDWLRADDCIVLREQPATAIYANKFDGLVIRQEKTWDREEDSFIYIRPEHAISFAKHLLKIAGYGEVEFSQKAGGGFVDLE